MLHTLSAVILTSHFIVAEPFSIYHLGSNSPSEAYYSLDISNNEDGEYHGMDLCYKRGGEYFIAWGKKGGGLAKKIILKID